MLIISPEGQNDRCRISSLPLLDIALAMPSKWCLELLVSRFANAWKVSEIWYNTEGNAVEENKTLNENRFFSPVVADFNQYVVSLYIHNHLSNAHPLLFRIFLRSALCNLVVWFKSFEA